MLSEDRYFRDNETGMWLPLGSSAETFGYSEGDEAENKILESIRAADDRSVFSAQLRAKIDDWSSMYHFSPRRSNLLRPVIENLDGAILEIGAGCGAITRYLGECGKEVLALEGSTLRAASAALRCSDLPSVTVLAAPFSSLQTERKFNTVLIIGVLEYARKFDVAEDDVDPCDAFLKRAKQFLNPGGKLVLAIENQLGLKYLAGFPEDHVGQAFFGIEDRYTDDSVVTFGRKELSSRLEKLFERQSWWFPFPDYKLPTTVITEKGALPGTPFDAASICVQSVRADPQKPSYTSFALDRAYGPFVRNGLLPDIANSFLIVASDADLPEDGALAFHYGFERAKGFGKEVKFSAVGDEIVVERHAIGSSSDSPLIGINLDNEQYEKGQLWQDNLRKIVSINGWTPSQIADWLKPWWETCCQALALDEPQRCDPRTLIAGKHIDLIPRNLMFNGTSFTFIDQEWDLRTPFELGFLLYRSVNDALLNIETFAPPSVEAPLVTDQLIIELLKELGYWFSREDLARYKSFERQFQEWVGGFRSTLQPTEVGVKSVSVRPQYEEVVAKYLQYGNLTQQISELDATLRSAEKRVSEMRSQYRSLIQVLADPISEKLSEKATYQEGIKKELRSLFDAVWYRRQYSDVAESGVDPFDHFITWGIREGRLPNGLWM